MYTDFMAEANALTALLCQAQKQILVQFLSICWKTKVLQPQGGSRDQSQSTLRQLNPLM